MNKLNSEQKSAATAPFGHNLIIASAGTGKTSTIVARIEHLLNNGIRPEKILLLTFTNKAAAEMIARLSKKFDESITKRIFAGTFHAMALNFLKILGKNIILKSPSELKTLLKSFVLERKFHHLSDIDAYSGAYLYEQYLLFQNTCEDEKNFEEWFKEKNSEQGVYSAIYADILQEFEKEKQHFGYADFNDLLIYLKKELHNGADLKFDEILVDEYQDTNLLQSSLIDAFKSKSLFCVGDFDQSIYAFNGADISIIGTFSKRYENSKVYALNTNYRSTQKILDLANKVIALNPRLYEKQLKVGRDEEANSPKLFIYSQLLEQYRAVAKKIYESKYPKDEIAVIFRNNSSGDGIEIALKELGINCLRKGSGSFFESKEIKALTSLLALLVNGRDIMAFIEIFQYAKGVGAAGARKIFDMLSQLGNGNAMQGLCSPNNEKIVHKKRKNYELGLFDEIFEMPQANTSNILKNHQICAFINEVSLEFLENLFELSKQKEPIAALNNIINSKIYLNIVKEIARKKSFRRNQNYNEKELESATQNILERAKSLLAMSSAYKDLQSFYNFLSLGKAEMNQGKGVNLLSVHASKGLEFNQVFIVDLAQGRFPNTKLCAMAGGIEEERRLFYVATTRAKDELFLSYAKNDKNSTNSYQPSQFLKEAGFKLDEI